MFEGETSAVDRPMGKSYVIPTPDTGSDVVKPENHVKNVDIADRTGLPNIAGIISKRR